MLVLEILRVGGDHGGLDLLRQVLKDAAHQLSDHLTISSGEVRELLPQLRRQTEERCLHLARKGGPVLADSLKAL